MRLNSDLNPTRVSPPRSRSRFLSFLPALLLFGLVTSCGKIGNPLPPEILIPKPVDNLTSRQIGNGFRLSWTLPSLNTNGSKATTIQRVEVYREMQPIDQPLPAANQVAKLFKGTKIISIDKNHFDAFSANGMLVFTDKFPGIDANTLPKSRFWYAVKVFNAKRQDAGFSNILIRQYLTTAAPISHIDFRAEETAINLTWDPPSSSAPIAGYNIYRSEHSKAYGLMPLNPEPVKENRFADKSFQFGTTYYYMIRSVSKEGTITAESEDSSEFALKPVDVFPPKSPTGLTTVFADGKMNLLWDPNLESDFAGYHVYRSEDGSTFHRISTELLKSPTFRDENIQAGGKYYYRVTALDTAGNESPPSQVAIGIAGGPN